MSYQFLKLPSQTSGRRHSTPVFYTSTPTTITTASTPSVAVNGIHQSARTSSIVSDGANEKRYSRSSDDIELPLLRGGSPTFHARLFPFLDRSKHNQNNQNNHHKANGTSHSPTPSGSEKHSPTFADRFLKMKPRLTRDVDGGSSGFVNERLKKKRASIKKSLKKTDS